MSSQQDSIRIMMQRVDITSIGTLRVEDLPEELRKELVLDPGQEGESPMLPLDFRGLGANFYQCYFYLGQFEASAIRHTLETVTPEDDFEEMSKEEYILAYLREVWPYVIFVDPSIVGEGGSSGAVADGRKRVSFHGTLEKEEEVQGQANLEQSFMEISQADVSFLQKAQWVEAVRRLWPKPPFMDMKLRGLFKDKGEWASAKYLELQEAYETEYLRYMECPPMPTVLFPNPKAQLEKANYNLLKFCTSLQYGQETAIQLVGPDAKELTLFSEESRSLQKDALKLAKEEEKRKKKKPNLGRGSGFRQQQGGGRSSRSQDDNRAGRGAPAGAQRTPCANCGRTNHTTERCYASGGAAAAGRGRGTTAQPN